MPVTHFVHLIVTVVFISQGALLGTFSGPGTNGQILSITTDSEVVGTHVVVQMRTKYINLMEIEVLGESAPDIGICFSG